MTVVFKFKSLLFQSDREVTRGALFECLMKWRHEVDVMFKGFTFSDQKAVDAALGVWMQLIRSQGAKIVMPPCMLSELFNKKSLEC